VNLGCNYDCEHCYLGDKMFAGLDWPGRERLLSVMADAGVLWLQLTGVITAMIADLPGTAEAVGVDPSPQFVARARRRAPSVRFEVTDGRALPFSGQSFEAVVFATTLCHIPRPEHAVAEACRVLRPGGSLLVYDGDYATSTVAITRDDPLQTCVATTIGTLVHDPWLVRRLPALVAAAGFVPGELHSHGYLEIDSPGYTLTLVDFGADTLATRGTISSATAEALKAEARRRAADGTYFGHIAYASLLAHRPA